MKNPKPHTLAALAIVFWWILFAATKLGLNAIPYIVKEKEFPLQQKLVHTSPWLIWCGLTFVVIYITRKLPLEKGIMWRRICQHAFVGLGVSLLHSLLSLGIKYPLSFAFDLPMPGFDWIIPILSYQTPYYYGIYWAIVGGTNGYDYYIRYRNSKIDAALLEAKLSQAELQSLKMQLQPHFLFNTHHSIISLMLKEQNAEAIRMLTQLSDLLRVTLERSHQQIASLKEEMDTLDLYLSIQSVRFKDRLSISANLAHNTLTAEVPYLILQPIVENAIKHGIDALSQNGKLTIATRRVADDLELSVHDNGPGMDATKAFDNDRGIGMKTTRSRLEQLYGKRQSILINSSATTGTKITIRIPYSESSHK